MRDVSGLGTVRGTRSRAVLDYLYKLRLAQSEAERTQLRAEFNAARLDRVRKAKRQRPEFLTIDWTTGPAGRVVPYTLTTKLITDRPVDLFAAGAAQYTNTGATFVDYHLDLRHSKDDQSYFITGDDNLERAHLFDFIGRSNSFTQLRELPFLVKLEPSQYLTADLYDEAGTAAAVRTLLMLVGRSSGGQGTGELTDEEEKQVVAQIAARDLPQFREVIATFTWKNGGAPGGTASFRSPALNEPVLVRGLYAPNALATTINKLRITENGMPFMTEAIPLKVISQCSEQKLLTQPLELPVPIFLPRDARLYADLANSIDGDGSGAFDADDEDHTFIKLFVETI